MITPKHMRTKQFTRYIYVCAIRDRETYIMALGSDGHYELDDETKETIEETKLEVEAIKHRLRIFDKKRR